MTERIIVLLDMDCFYVQVDERDNPHIKGKPAAVVQYNSWKGGGIIAVNYEAREFGVKRGMRGAEAKEKCPSIFLVQVPVQREKADLSKYRNAGKEVVSVLCEFSDCVERASIDEAYIDLTKVIENKMQVLSKEVTGDDLPSTWVVGYDQVKDDALPQTVRKDGLTQWLNESLGDEESDLHSPSFNLDTTKLSLAAVICEEMRAKVLEVTGFKCSAGISHNKMLSKLACGLHKPNQQSVLPMSSVSGLWKGLPIGKIRNLGGKLGESLTTDLRCHTMGQLSNVSLAQLRSKYDEKTAFWLHSLGRGIDSEQVTSRQLAKSIGCGKNFNGKDILNTRQKVHTWMRTLADELSERLEEDRLSNERIAKTLTVHVRIDQEQKPVSTRSCPLSSYRPDAIARIALALIGTTNTASPREDKWHPSIRNISLSACKFEDASGSGTTKINDIFKKVDAITFLKDSSPHRKEKNKAPECSNSANVSSPPQNSTPKSKGKDIPRKNAPRNSFFLQFMSHTKLENVNASSDSDFVSDTEKSENDNEKKFDYETDEEDGALSNELDNDSDSVYKEMTDVDEERSKSPDTRPNIKYRETSPILKTKRKHDSHPLNSNPPRLIVFEGKKEESGSEETRNENLPSSSSFFLNSKRKSSDLKESSSCVSVHEIFPDLDDVDASLLEMLPTQLKEKVKREIQKHRSRQQSTSDVANGTSPKDGGVTNGSSPLSTDNDEVESKDTTSREHVFNPDSERKFCKECNRKILSSQFLEHTDYHFAMELRKQQMVETGRSIVEQTKKKLNESNGKSTTKSKRFKKNPSVNALTPKIENYFKKL